MAAFYREHGRVVLAQVLLVTGERVLAEEVVQDTMLAIWRGAGSFRGESSVRSWVISIARRQTRDRLRGQRLRVVDDAVLEDQPIPGPGPEVTALDRAELAEVEARSGSSRRPTGRCWAWPSGRGSASPRWPGCWRFRSGR